MTLQDSRIPQSTIQRPGHHVRIGRNQTRIPRRKLASVDERYRFPRIEVLLPVGKIHHQAEIIPRQHARQARADDGRIRAPDVLVGLLVDVQLLIQSLGIPQRDMSLLVQPLQENREKEAPRQDCVSPADDPARDDRLLAGDEGADGLADAGEDEDVAGPEPGEEIEEEFRGEVRERCRLLRCFTLLLSALGAFGAQGEGFCGVYEGFLVFDHSWGAHVGCGERKKTESCSEGRRYWDECVGGGGIMIWTGRT